MYAASDLYSVLGNALITQSVLASHIMANLKAFSQCFSPWSHVVLGLLDAVQVQNALWGTTDWGEWKKPGTSGYLDQKSAMCLFFSSKKPRCLRFTCRIICNRINILACHILQSRNASDFPALGICNSLERVADVCPNADIFSAV